MHRAAVLLTAPDGVAPITVDTAREPFVSEQLGGLLQDRTVTFVASVESSHASIVLVCNRAEQEAFSCIFESPTPGAARALLLHPSILPPPLHREPEIFGKALALRVDLNGEDVLDLHPEDYLREAVSVTTATAGAGQATTPTPTPTQTPPTIQ